MLRTPNRFIFMKVGSHAGETFEEILKRKNKEYEKRGMIFWGYGGNTLHPTKHVQPFAQTYEKSGSIYLMMQSINSNADPDLMPATEYSKDGIEWEPIPNDIFVTGSRYALILDEIKPGDLTVTLNNYQVAVGNSMGKMANDYLKGHVDKGCFVRSEVPPDVEKKESIKKVSYLAKLKYPYSVFLR
jgi:hypothetical protein